MPLNTFCSDINDHFSMGQEGGEGRVEGTGN